MATVQLNEQNFEQEVLKSEQPVMVDFYAEWCGPCKMVAPVVEELATQYGEQMKFCKLDIDNAQSLAANYGVSSVPTLMIFKEGQNVDQIIGALPKPQLEEHVKKILGS